MDARNGSEAVRRTILALVGRGHTAAEITDRLGAHVDDRDLQYAESLVKVRDEVRSEKLQSGVKPKSVPAGA
jgi:hypothetical protein